MVEGEVLAHTTRSIWLGRDYCENCTYLFFASMLHVRVCRIAVKYGTFFHNWITLVERSAKTKSKLVMILMYMKLVMIKRLLEYTQDNPWSQQTRGF